MTTSPPPPPPPPGAVAASDAAIAVINVSRWYGNVVAVNDISFGIGPGVTGLLGPNGAGKSTMLHMLSGFLRPSNGEVRVLGKSTWQHPDMYRQVGLVPEREAVYPFLTGYEFVLLAARLQKLPDPEAAAARAIRLVDLESAQHRATGGYSKGMKQRVKVAAAIVHEPQVLLLDEPFNGADPRQRLHMMDMLRRMAADGKTIVFSSHILEEVERLAENVLVIVAGRLAASGDFRAIRQLMTDRPHTFTVQSSDNRRLASALVADPSVFGVELEDGRLSVRTSEFAAFTVALPKVAQAAEVSVFELRPTDESLESVFSYLVKR
ncbi:MAG: ABC transporter ATP-binding protein [Dehalococcoidia bacterium]|nr:ABC transporter ATP-binding protein [Dehalococcoidia bacterium]